MQFELARRYYGTGRFELAGRTFEASFELSGHRELLYNAHMAYRQAGLFRDALRTLEGYVPSVEDPTARAANEARLERLRAIVARLEPESQESEPAVQPAEEVDDAVTSPSDPSDDEVIADQDVAQLGPADGSRRILWSTVGATSALALVSVGTGVAALRADRDLDAAGCSNALCPATAADTLDRGRRLQRATDGLWISALIIGVVGTIWTLVRRSRSQRDASIGEVRF